MDSTVQHWPIIVLLLGIATVVILIAVFRIHAFLSLICASVVVGVLTQQLPGEYSNHYVRAVELAMTEFGVVAGKIAFVIALAAILGVALTMSGAAEKIVIKFIGLLGEKLAPVALLVSGFVLSIPVFFDTVFFLLIPIAYSMGQKIRKDYVLFVMAISAGAAITHSLVPPTPGPLVMAEDLSLNLGLVIVVGFLAGIIPAIIAYLFAKRLSKRVPIEPPVMQDQTQEEPLVSLPSFGLAILPIIVPLVLIINSSALDYFSGGNEEQGAMATFWHFIGNKNIAMLLGTVIALWLLAKQKGWGIKRLGVALEKPLEIAGIIILITSAGGAFGGMIKHSGIGDWIKELALGGVELNYVLLAWLVSAIMKIAQGSGTVAMITTAGIMVTLTTGIELPYHPVYLLLAIGFGSMFISWMNDSGFWVVCKMSGFTEKQTLQTWTVTLGLIGLVGLVQVLILSKVIPLI